MNHKVVYVKVYENRFVLKLCEDGELPTTVIATESFTTKHLLVGQFTAAERALKSGFDRIVYMNGRTYTLSSNQCNLQWARFLGRLT